MADKFKIGDIVRVFGSREANFLTERAMIEKKRDGHRNEYHYKDTVTNMTNYAHEDDMELLTPRIITEMEPIKTIKKKNAVEIVKPASPIEEFIEATIASEIKKTLVDSKEAEKIIGELLKSYRKVEIKVPDKKLIKLDEIPHKDFERILPYVSAKIHLMLVGPAGSGKTHIAALCAKALDIDHYSISVNEQTSKADFLGYTDANGKVVATNFRKAYENGGMFIVDEIDCANPNILTVINSALSNDLCPFPDGMVKRNEDFFCVCTANTFGEGESIQYIGRNILDAATRDRFATLIIGYDHDLERRISIKFANLVKELRTYSERNNNMIVFSTRAIQRLKKFAEIKERLSVEELKNCLNLHSIKDVQIESILQKYVA